MLAIRDNGRQICENFLIQKRKKCSGPGEKGSEIVIPVFLHTYSDGPTNFNTLHVKSSPDLTTITLVVFELDVVKCGPIGKKNIRKITNLVFCFFLLSIKL